LKCTLVQILEIVAIIQIENLKIEAEKGFRRTLIDPELVDPNLEINFVKVLGGVRKDQGDLESSLEKGK
jgi:hypothetical protein